MKRTAAFLFVFFLALLISSCRKGGVAGEGGGAGEAPPDTTVRIAYVPALDALPFFVAGERGLFEAEGLDVSLMAFDSHLDIDTALAGGSADGAFTDIIRVGQLKKKDSLDLDVLTSTETQWALITNRTARLNRLQQFGDKMIAMTRFSATDWLSDRVMEGVKTNAMVFKVQINNVELRLKMLLNNAMDALWLPEPYATRALMAGHREILRSDKFGKKFGVLVLRHAFAVRKENAGVAEKLTAIYSMACDTINKYGVRSFAGELAKYCRLDSSEVNRLPLTRYSRAEKPTAELLEEAAKFLNKE